MPDNNEKVEKSVETVEKTENTSAEIKINASPPEKSDKEKRTDLIVKIITVAIFILLGAYLIYQFIPKDAIDKIPNDNPNVTTSSTAITLSPDYTNTTEPVDFNNPINSIMPDERPEQPEYDISANQKVVLNALGDKAMCYVYIPVGYEARINNQSVMLKPDKLDDKVTGNDPLTIYWGNCYEIGKFDENNEFDWREHTGSTYYQYHVSKVIDSYKCILHEHADATVYIIEETKIISEENLTKYDENNGISIIYRIVVDLPSELNSRPIIDIRHEDLERNTSMRYPDVPSLARAIFIPVDPDDLPDTTTSTEATNTPETIITENTDTTTTTEQPVLSE